MSVLVLGPSMNLNNIKNSPETDGRLQPLSVLFVNNVCASWSVAEDALCDRPDESRVFSCFWETIPALDQLLDDLVQSLADSVGRLWPDWYGQSWDQLQESSSTEKSLRADWILRQLVGSRPNVIASWASEAVRLIMAGQRPYLPDVPRAIQIEQLSLALDAPNLVILLGASETTSAGIRVLTAAAEWLANSSRARVVILAPETCRDLDALRRWPETLLPHESLITPEWPASRSENSFFRSSNNRVTQTLNLSRGYPHHNSPGEQLLFARLEQDAELGPLFAFNRNVEIDLLTRYCVDLLWRDGKVVIEIDGMRSHLNRYAFVRDRERDHHLMLQGYRVLRLPHEVVIEDMELAVERIRNVVRFVQQ